MGLVHTYPLLATQCQFPGSLFVSHMCVSVLIPNPSPAFPGLYSLTQGQGQTRLGFFLYVFQGIFIGLFLHYFKGVSADVDISYLRVWGIYFGS